MISAFRFNPLLALPATPLASWTRPARVVLQAGEGASAASALAPSDVLADLAHAVAGQDTFIFAPNFGQATLSHFTPTTDAIQISSTVFANVAAVLAATHDDGYGDAVITDAAHDTITIQNVTTAQLLAHQGDFHIV
jgi:serralysin